MQLLEDLEISWEEEEEEEEDLVAGSVEETERAGQPA